jgi:putative serine protease PepD
MVRRVLASVAAMGAAAVLAACGSSGESGATTSATAASGPGTAAAQATTGADGEGVPAAALAYQEALVGVVDRVAPSVVQISTQQGLGSGVVFDSKGHIVTNAHVVGSADRFVVTTRSGTQLQATLVGVFVPDDLAVIRVSGGDLRPAEFGDSSKLSVGDIVVAIGNPLGLQSSVTDGIVSALGRTVSEPNGATLPSVIQTSAPINPGNSGGALVDLAGRVIGIPTLAATDPQLGGSTAPGIGFAIPSNVVTDIASQLIEHGRVVDSHRAYLGVEVGDTGGSGVFVGSVQSGGPADKAGIQAGDLIVSVAGEGTPTTIALSHVLATLKPGQTVDVEVVTQDGQRKTVRATLGEYPSG